MPLRKAPSRWRREVFGRTRGVQKTAIGAKLVERFDLSSLAPDHLTFTQARSFRDEILKHKDDSEHSTRLLRIIRHLDTSKLAHRVLTNSAMT
jgi:hypothetical protein